ncbi:DUF2490 domain-containing protein [Hymenobacter busanensis]|uniref:DUF2490 domain-containing protein n=1 Tax=Hymenobacter busanensis TaxID=2607656 RepID=A0A7L4ZSZ5_9BACT|nr:DUF2490 domain-containing protein [Hymenobacter busanensis]KAA9327618.1 DUF2490 domain-containing protein [Hymenobacter busanensis]QHJ06043.1 DUF2490 domain-containing protein [Hymenobacter busanensis]
MRLRLDFTTGTLLGLLTVFASPARAQTPINPAQPWGSWFIGTLQLPGTAEHRWGGFFEAQARTNAVFRQYFYNELKGGVSFDIDRNFTALLGGGRYATRDYQDWGAGPLNVEKRLWGQVVLSQQTSRLKLEHRYRVEQRWFRYRADTSSTRLRLRYRLNAFLPLNHKTIGPKTVFLSVYDELFLNPNGPVFERNRVYGGVGYQATTHVALQVGWVHQANYNLPAFKQGQFIPQNTSAKNNVVLALTYRLARKATAPAPERLPSQQD